MHKVYIGLGSNIGNKEHHLNTAIKKIEQFSNVTKVSSFHNTKPVGFTDQDDFLNACIEIETSQEPLQLLHTLLNIEKEMGRERTFKNAPRIIDLDILIYDNVKINTNELTIPHPRMWEREFVLIPLKEIAPEIINKRRL